MKYFKEDFEDLKYGLSYAKSLKKRFSNFELPSSYLYNHVFSYKLLWNLYHDFDKWKAFSYGIIDKDGNELRKPQSKEEHESWNYYYKIIAKLKKELKTVVNKKRLEKIYNRLFLVREQHEMVEVENMLIEFMNNENINVDKALLENVVSGDIAGFGNGFNKSIKRSNMKVNFKDFLEQGKTSKDAGHYHLAKVDQKGNGETIKTMGGANHVHKITNLTVEPVNNHSHMYL